MHNASSPVDRPIYELSDTPFDTALARVEGKILRVFDPRRGTGYTYQNFYVENPKSSTPVLVRLSDREAFDQSVIGKRLVCVSLPKAPRGIVWEQDIGGDALPPKGRVVVRRSARVEVRGTDEFTTATSAPRPQAPAAGREPELFDASVGPRPDSGSTAIGDDAALRASEAVAVLERASLIAADPLVQRVFRAQLMCAFETVASVRGMIASTKKRDVQSLPPQDPNRRELERRIAATPSAGAIVEAMARFSKMLNAGQTWRDLSEDQAGEILASEAFASTAA